MRKIRGTACDHWELPALRVSASAYANRWHQQSDGQVHPLRVDTVELPSPTSDSAHRTATDITLELQRSIEQRRRESLAATGRQPDDPRVGDQRAAWLDRLEASTGWRIPDDLRRDLEHIRHMRVLESLSLPQSSPVDGQKDCADCAAGDLEVYYEGQRWNEVLCQTCYEVRVAKGAAKPQKE